METFEQKCPVAVVASSGRGRILRHSKYTPPFCRLHALPILDSLPARCPLRSPHPTSVIGSMQDAGWHMVGREDFEGGSAMLARVETCLACVRRNAKNPTVARLRRGLNAA